MNQRDSAAPWPAGGGQCEERTRTFAWAATELGASPAWPEHLRVLVDTLLRSPAPMVLLWGERGILLYNDACLRIAGARHPAAFGKPVAEGWPEIAGPNLGVIARVLQGESISLRDQQVMIKRNGTDEQAWFDLDFSPVLDDAGRPAGTLAVVAETTRRVTRDGALAARSEHEFSSLAEAAPLHVWAADAQGSLYWFNARVYQSTGAAPGSLDGVAWGRVVHPDDLAKAAETWANAVGAGVTYETEFRIWSEPDNDNKCIWCARCLTPMKPAPCAGSAPIPTSRTRNWPRNSWRR